MEHVVDCTSLSMKYTFPEEMDKKTKYASYKCTLYIGNNPNTMASDVDGRMLSFFTFTLLGKFSGMKPSVGIMEYSQQRT